MITLFHEFGHGLHQLLTRVEELGVSGINGVEWDAVELPSQFMENFCWEWDVVEPMTRHVETGERMPRALFDRMLAAKNFQSGMQIVRQLEFALFDMHLHHDFDAAGATHAAGAAGRRAARGGGVPRARRTTASRNQFSHIFAGGYAAGYYSYKWAEVLSADAFGAVRGGRACSTRPSASASARGARGRAAAARRSNRSSPSAAASRRSTRFCVIMG